MCANLDIQSNVLCRLVIKPVITCITFLKSYLGIVTEIKTLV